MTRFIILKRFIPPYLTWDGTVVPARYIPEQIIDGSSSDDKERMRQDKLLKFNQEQYEIQRDFVQRRYELQLRLQQELYEIETGE